MNIAAFKFNIAVLPQGYERVRRVSEDDNSTAPSYEDDEEEGLDEVPSRESLPKQVRDSKLSLLIIISDPFYFML